MYIKFIKDHPSGIVKGVVALVLPAFSKRMIEGDYAEEATEEDLNEYKAELIAKRGEIIEAKDAIEGRRDTHSDS